MKQPLFCLLLLAVFLPPSTRAPAQTQASSQARSSWRTATPEELEAFLPARAPVEKERIETEMRTASGIISDRGHLIAGVVLITAGYSADGKYSHYLLTQSTLTLGDSLSLPPGAYVLGWKRVEAGLEVHLYEAATGVERGVLTAGAARAAEAH